MIRPEIDVERCLRFRCRAFECTRCADACPVEAIRVDGEFRIDRELCVGCGACSAACPADGLRFDDDPVEAVLADLRAVEQPVLGCREKSFARGHARVECLGALAGEHLVALALLVPQGLQLNATRCGDCPRSGSLSRLRQQAARLRTDGAAGSGGWIRLVEDPAALEFREVALDRRGFFRSLRTRTASGAGRLMARTDPRRPEGRSAKALPRKRAVLNAALGRLPEAARERVRERVCHEVAIGPSCTACPRCAAMCPTGALRRVRDGHGRRIEFDRTLCTGCGVCVAFCPEGALVLSPPPGPVPERSPGRAVGQ